MPRPASESMEIDFAIRAGISMFHLHRPHQFNSSNQRSFSNLFHYSTSKTFNHRRIQDCPLFLCQNQESLFKILKTFKHKLELLETVPKGNKGPGDAE